MIATIEIYKDGCMDSKPIILTKEHNDLSVLRNWQQTIANKKSDEAMVIGSIDKFEAFVHGAKMVWNSSSM